MLQMAWREKKKTGSNASAVRLSSSFKAAGGSLFEDSGSSRIIPSDPLASSFFKSISGKFTLFSIDHHVHILMIHISRCEGVE